MPAKPPSRPPRKSTLPVGGYTGIMNTRLPDGSGFDKLIRRRADKNNLPGPQNHFGDNLGRGLNTQLNNPRQGQEYTSSMDARGRIIHTYKYGKNTNRVVLPKKKKNGGTFKFY